MSNADTTNNRLVLLDEYKTPHALTPVRAAAASPSSFLLAPPPPPRSRSTSSSGASQGLKLATPHSRTTSTATATRHRRSNTVASPTSAKVCFPRSPLTPRDDTNVPYSFLNAPPPVETSPRKRTKSTESRDRNRSKSVTNSPKQNLKYIEVSMPNLLSRQTSSKPPTSGSSSRRHDENVYGYGPGSQPRRGSVPTIPSRGLPSSRSNGKQATHDHDKRRYPLPLPYGAIVEMNTLMGGDGFRAQDPYAASQGGGDAFTRGASQAAHIVPYIGADGRVWRDQEEELEYAGLLAASPITSRRPSAQEEDSDDEYEIEYAGEERSKGKWRKFANGQATVQRLRMPLSPDSATSSSDEEPHSAQPWSPLMQHEAYMFPSYATPASAYSPAAQGSFGIKSRSSRQPHHLEPMPARMADFAVGGSTFVNVSARGAKDEFLANSFRPAVPQMAPAPSSRMASRPPVSGPPSSSRGQQRRASVSDMDMSAMRITAPAPHARAAGEQKKKGAIMGVFGKRK